MPAFFLPAPASSPPASFSRFWFLRWWYLINSLINKNCDLAVSLTYWTDLPASTFFDPTKFSESDPFWAFRENRAGKNTMFHIQDLGFDLKRYQAQVKRPQKYSWPCFRLDEQIAGSFLLSLRRSLGRLQIVYRGKCLHEHYQTLVMSVQNTWKEEYGWFQRLWRLCEYLWHWFNLHILQCLDIKLLILQSKRQQLPS